MKHRALSTEPLRVTDPRSEPTTCGCTERARHVPGVPARISGLPPVALHTYRFGDAYASSNRSGDLVAD